MIIHYYEIWLSHLLLRSRHIYNALQAEKKTIVECVEDSCTDSDSNAIFVVTMKSECNEKALKVRYAYQMEMNFSISN